ncbi:hypothetical protein F4Z99_01985 [Candidatus Poribacteria bacterium]|nr:hypothetical protein [Candidatus Poribacteria bacterium]MYB01962.1 hypothetical protein [Candidatus Poribacteria bacterium]
MKRKIAYIFDTFYRFSLCTYLLCSLMLISCSRDQGDWTIVQREGRYIYGVWHSSTAKRAEQTMLEVAGNIKAFSTQVGESPATESVLQTTLSPENLLPNNGELLGWVQSLAPSTYQGKTLYRDRATSPDLYYAYGFKRQAEVEYETPRFGSKPLILLEIFDMGTPENAFGIYNFHTYPRMEFEWVGSKAMLSGGYLRFSKGKYFVQIEGYEFATGIREGMITLAKAVAAQIKDPPPKPQILALLPNNKRIHGSTKLFRSNWALSQIYSTLPANVPQLTDTALGISAHYQNKSDSTDWMDAQIVFIIRFPDAATAESAFVLYRDTVDALIKGTVDSEKRTDGAVLINEPSAL